MEKKFWVVGAILAFMLALAPPSLAAAPKVSLDLPALDPSLGALKSALESESARFLDELNDNLSDVMVEKPRLMKGFGDAAARGALIPWALGDSPLPWVAFGIGSAVYAEPFDWGTGARVAGMDESSDEAVGAAVEPFVIAAQYPLDRWFPCYYASGSLGLMDISTDDYRLRSFSLGLSVGYRFPGKSLGAVEWLGVTVEGGADFAWSSVGVFFKPGRVSQTVTLDEDGSGPLPSFDSTLSVDPEVLAALETRAFAITGAVSTGVSVIDAITLFGGAGLTISAAHAELSLESDDAVAITGHLADLAQSDCRVRTSGAVCSGGEVSAGFFLEGCARFGAGALSLGFPVVWSPARSFGAGVFLGVNF
jgi:hypothetical protein